MGTHKAMAVERGCGTRLAGGIYAEVGLSPRGRPIEDFIIDPPVPADAEELGISPIGVYPKPDTDGVVHVLDWIGSQHYPNVADFIEEVRLFGLSRRIPTNFAFGDLSEESRIVCLHRRAFIDNAIEYYDFSQYAAWCCPKKIPDHAAPWGHPGLCCAGLWWHDLEDPDADDEAREIVRAMPSFSYQGKLRSPDIVPEYQLAFFLSLPIHRLAVIRDPAGGTHEEAAEKARHAGVPVELEDH